MDSVLKDIDSYDGIFANTARILLYDKFFEICYSIFNA